jgi:hypothetical protein
VIAAIRGAGDYRYWHISGRLYKSIPGLILRLMAQEGWKPNLKTRGTLDLLE